MTKKADSAEAREILKRYFETVTPEQLIEDIARHDPLSVKEGQSRSKKEKQSDSE